MGQNENLEEEDMFVTLSLDDGTEMECKVLTIFEIEELSQDYIVLLPLDNDGEDDEEEVFIYRYFEDEDGNPSVEDIEDDEECEIVEECFEQLLDEDDLEEL